MKTTLILLILLTTLTAKAQTPLGKKMLCDSVLMTDGSIRILQIKEVRRKKIIYFTCCVECAVPKELMRSDVDTIYFNQEKKRIEQKKELQAIADKQPIKDSTGYLVFTKMDKPSKKKRTILNGSKTIIRTNDSLKIKGDFYFLNPDSIRINQDTLAISTIYSIKKLNMPARKFGNIGGTFTSVWAVALGLFAPAFGLALAVPATGFFMMRLIGKEFDLQKEWTVGAEYEVFWR